MKKKTKLVILHNIISPYRLPLFEELSKKYDLCVYFCKEKTKDRLWSTFLDNYTFKYKILPHLSFGPLDINFTFLKELFINKFDCYLAAENPENAISILTLFAVAKKNKGKIALWSERINDEIASLLYYKKSGNLLANKFYNFIKAIYKNYREYLYSKSDVLIPLSNAAKSYLKLNSFLTKKVKRSFQIMPESLLAKSAKSMKLEYKNKKIILSLGRLVEDKGVDNLIKAFNKLKRDDSVLIIAGNGNQRNHLRKLAEPNKNIIFPGYIEGTKKANYYASSCFFVFPTHSDVWGFVVNEALYYGLPVISSDKACASELIENEKTGFVFKDNDVEELAEKMEELLDNKNLLVEMKKNVKKINKSKLVDINIFVRSFEEALNYALK